MTVNVIRNYVNKFSMTVDSVDALVNSRRLSSLGEVYIQSFYDGWQATTAGPKGGHLVHTTGGTASAPTVPPAVSVGTIGSGAQAGYYWDLDGNEWFLSDDQIINFFTFGARGDTTTGSDGTDDYNAIQACINYFETKGGGTIKIPAGSQFRSDTGLSVTNQNLAIIGEGGMALPTIWINADTTGITLSSARFVAKQWQLISTQGGVGTATSYGVYGQTSTPYVDFEDFTVHSFPGHGFLFDSVFVSKFNNVHSFENGGKGFVVSDGTSLDITSFYARANGSGGYQISNVAYMNLGALAADDNVGRPYYFVECFSGFIGAMGLEGNAVDADTSLVLFEGCINFTVNGIYLTQNTGGGPADGKSKIEVLDGSTYNTNGLRIRGVRIQSNGSPGTQYSYNINCATNGSVYIEDADDIGTINNSAGLATFKGANFDFWSTSSGGVKSVNFDLNNGIHLFGSDAVSNGSVDGTAGIGTQLGGQMRFRRNTAVGGQIANWYGAVVGGGEIRFLDDGSAFSTTGTWGTISDKKFKTNVTYLTKSAAEKAVDLIKQLKFANFVRNGHDEMGLIAQDVQAVFPELVKKQSVDDNDPDSETFLTILESLLYRRGLLALQNLIERVEKLEKSIK